MKNILEWIAALTGLLVFGALMSVIVLIGMAV